MPYLINFKNEKMKKVLSDERLIGVGIVIAIAVGVFLLTKFDPKF